MKTNKKPKEITLDFVKKEAARINGSKDEAQNKPVVLILSSIVHGPNIKRLSKFTKMTRGEIAWRAANLRRNGVWVGSRIKSDYFEKKGLGTMNVLLDSCVAEGYMSRGPGIKG